MITLMTQMRENMAAMAQRMTDLERPPGPVRHGFKPFEMHVQPQRSSAASAKVYPMLPGISLHSPTTQPPPPPPKHGANGMPLVTEEERAMLLQVREQTPLGTQPAPRQGRSSGNMSNSSSVLRQAAPQEDTMIEETIAEAVARFYEFCDVGLSTATSCSSARS